MITPKHHLFICSSCRLNGNIQGYCASHGAASLAGLLVELLDENELSNEIMLTHTGCFGICEKGPVLVVYPEGVWYGNLNEDAIEQIVDQHLIGGDPVKDYLI